MDVEPGAAVLLPCNVVLKESGPGKTEVLFLDAEQAFRLIGNPALEPIAKEAPERLRRAARVLVGEATPAV